MPANRVPIIGYPLSQTALEGVLRSTLAEVWQPMELERLERKGMFVGPYLYARSRRRYGPHRVPMRRSARVARRVFDDNGHHFGVLRDERRPHFLHDRQGRLPCGASIFRHQYSSFG